MVNFEFLSLCLECCPLAACQFAAHRRKSPTARTVEEHFEEEQHHVAMPTLHPQICLRVKRTIPSARTHRLQARKQTASANMSVRILRDSHRLRARYSADQNFLGEI